MSTVYLTPRPRRGRRRRPTFWSRLAAQFRYVLEVGL